MNEYPTTARDTEPTLLRDLEYGDWFKLTAKAKKVYEKHDYCYSTKRYICVPLNDIFAHRYFPTNKEVLIDFEF
jgi:hypothetical protein